MSPDGEGAIAPNLMKGYKENEHSDSQEKVISLEGEEPEAQKPNQNKKWWNFVAYWRAKCYEIKSVKDAAISLKKDKTTYHRIRKLYTKEQIFDIIDFFLNSKKADEYLTITACFSAHTINQWKRTR